MRRVRTLFLVICCALAATGVQAAERVYEIEARPGGKFRTLVVAPDNPKAVAVLFAGGSGRIGLKKNGTIKRGGNFLVRSRGRFAANGIVAAVIDAPKDHKDSDGLSGGFRGSAEHARDMAALIARLSRDYKLPVWLVGTSRGANSVASLGVRLTGTGIAGLVFTSSLTEPNERGPQVLEFDLKQITEPVLVVHHKRDLCPFTPPSGAKEIYGAAINARARELMLFEGGIDRGDDCRAMAHHGFNGIEDSVVAAIAGWMKRH